MAVIRVGAGILAIVPLSFRVRTLGLPAGRRRILPACGEGTPAAAAASADETGQPTHLFCRWGGLKVCGS